MINIVLYEPEIPENTGNIMRTCAGTNSKLHLIRPLGFRFDLNHLKRSGVNYLDKVNYELYDDYEDFLNKNKGEFYYFTRYGNKCYSEVDYSDTSKNIYLVFGKESSGIPKEILKKNISNCVRIPISDNIRCLNVANSVCIGLYEVLRQQNYPNLLFKEVFKGEDYLTKD